MGTSQVATAPGVSPLGAVVRGAMAGAVGTVALDAYSYAQYRAGGGTDKPLAWELSEGLDDWDKAPAPAQIGRRLAEGLLQRPLPPSSARLVNNVTHWGYGILWGAQFGVVAASTGPRKLRGPIFGTMVWLSGYVVLPLAHLYKPIWEYDAKTLAKDWGGHLAYGTATSVAFSILAGRAGRAGRAAGHAGRSAERAADRAGQAGRAAGRG